MHLVSSRGLQSKILEGTLKGAQRLHGESVVILGGGGLTLRRSYRLLILRVVDRLRQD
jgi:hypothetical protein